MFRSAILRAGKVPSRATFQPQLIRFQQSAGAGFVGIRFKSSDSSSVADAAADVTSKLSEIQTQLPSFDESTIEAVSQLGQAVGDASNQIGYLSSIGMAKSWLWPPDLIQNVMEQVHVYAGLPWWATICVTTVLARVLLFPLYVKYSDTLGRTSRIKPEMDKVNADLMSCSDTTKAQQIAMKRKKLLSENGIKNRYLLVPVVQIPIAISFFTSIREMCIYPVDGLATQGIAWFQNLTLADPYLGLQCLTAAMFVALARKGGESGAQQFSPQMKKVFTFLPILTIPVTMNLSAGVVLYLAVNGVCSMIQTLLLRSESARKFLNIAEVVHHPTPANQGPQKGVFESFRENIQKARDQAEKRATMKENDDKMKDLAKKEKENQRIKIVRKK
ncbi:unnamed protein product [Kluyveromyces dobzhanskii CBS 2104]|uniref:WGS project CCBQ000000000 data, contig 00223 n=1 Tax=Kluyveromyces dobzhanskii CBS 2104 TaxID=1427455 RepID=A0A0A8L7G8_9SACH|nr:unnamed protein product [Kluyveromyces dobzhanskii CBS 2104]